MIDKIIEEDIEMIDIVITIEAGIDQEKGHSQEIIVVAEIILPLDSRIGGQNRDCPTVGQYLTRDQTLYI